MSKRTYLRASQFEPHPEDAEAVEQLSGTRFCQFGLTPRGRVYGVGGCLADTNVDALMQLSLLIDVSVLNLAPTPIFTDTGLEQLLLHPSLKIFGCAQNPALTDNSAAALASSSQMRWLCLNGCAITDVGVDHISEHHQLLGLYLADTQITNDCVPNLCRLTNLRLLRLQGTSVTESVRDELVAKLPKCRSIQLGNDRSCQPRNEIQ